MNLIFVNSWRAYTWRQDMDFGDVVDMVVDSRYPIGSAHNLWGKVVEDLKAFGFGDKVFELVVLFKENAEADAALVICRDIYKEPSLAMTAMFQWKDILLSKVPSTHFKRVDDGIILSSDEFYLELKIESPNIEGYARRICSSPAREVKRDSVLAV